MDQFITELKDKLIKKVHPHAPEDLATAIRHAKNYKMTIEEADYTKLVNLAIEKTRQYTKVLATCGTFNKKSEEVPVFEFEEEKELPITKTFIALRSPSNWAEETEQEIFEETKRWNVVRYSTPEPWKQPLYIPLKYKDYNKKLLLMGAYISPEEEYKTLHLLLLGGVCDQTCQYALLISKKIKRGTSFDAAYNSAFNKLYHYFYNAKIIFDLAMALINRATQKDIQQMKEAEYIEYTMELAGFNYKDEIETYHQIASHTYPTQKAQIQ
ncbi:hypothetical protein G9A89_008898 [Geosiphon pyriformis]|nr:hypothetical protein G9A89_008898 [Geosiphon pyriformis]